MLQRGSFAFAKTLQSFAKLTLKMTRELKTAQKKECLVPVRSTVTKIGSDLAITNEWSHLVADSMPTSVMHQSNIAYCL